MGFKYCNIGHIKLMCWTSVHYVTGDNKFCYYDAFNFDESNNHILSLFTTLVQMVLGGIEGFA